MIERLNFWAKNCGAKLNNGSHIRLVEPPAPPFIQEPRRQPLAPSPRPANRNQIPDRPSPELGVREDPNGLLGLDLRDKPWFHGELDRAAAEYLLQKDGDFLVRTSANSPGQFILDGMEQGKHRHILLINDGVVRTVTTTFPSVSALINYHYGNRLPISTQESIVYLTNPILKSSTDTHHPGARRQPFMTLGI
ncbi:hypothetical protein Y032_0170g269 [Ancylostoma ceylanicum]|uniref:SH2 domain-containing protein n=1 Tax=Ancylostoma ceylanicum TaxID=53326 RepID=A0A016SVR1_9BILA|nr:hypothetical protein Y032_0170g269 [Ancylostoma ceylanicum]